MPNRSLVIVTSLVGGIDATKSLLQRQFGQTLRCFLFPGSAIEESWNLSALDTSDLLTIGLLTLVVDKVHFAMTCYQLTPSIVATYYLPFRSSS